MKNTKVGERYYGWLIVKDEWAPVTGRYRATRFGVSMCHNTEEGLVNMIHQKANLVRQERS